jgi:hypothetical protein
MNSESFPVLRLRRPVPRPTPPVLPPAAAREERRLLRVAATCPRCSSRPAMRVTPALVEAMAALGADTRVATYQCQRRGCGTVYDLSAGAFQNAS